MIRIFIGTSPNGEDAEANAVLEYTLRANASEPLDITWLMLSRNPSSPCGGWRTDHFNTPFSALRWAVPEMCGWSGRAIYMDTDVFVLGDIAELWNQPMDGKAMLVEDPDRTPQWRTCVMLMDCAELKPYVSDLHELKKLKLAHDVVLKRIPSEKVGQFENLWNCVDLKSSSLSDPALRAVHYSSIAHQPHFPYARKRLRQQSRHHWYDGEHFDHWRPELRKKFDELLEKAIAAGFTPKQYDPGRIQVPFVMASYKGRRVKGFSR